jgi:hypothetical protein
MWGRAPLFTDAGSWHDIIPGELLSLCSQRCKHHFKNRPDGDHKWLLRCYATQGVSTGPDAPSTHRTGVKRNVSGSRWRISLAAFPARIFHLWRRNMRSLLIVGTFAAGALYFVTFLATVKPTSVGVKESSSNSSTAARMLSADRYAATSNQCQAPWSRRRQYCSL